MCEQCAALVEQNHALQERAVKDFEQQQGLVEQLAASARREAALKGQLTKLRTDSPKMADAEEVFRFWVQRLHKNARTNFGPKRQEKVIARLKEKSSHPELDRKADLKWAIRGCEALPYSGDFARWAKPAPGRKKKDDLAVVCHDETSVERFCGYADDQADGAFRTFVQALVVRFGRRVDASYDGHRPFHVVAPCPVCETDWALVAIPGTVWSGDLLWIECTSGCSPDEIKERLRAPVLEVAAA